MENKETPKEILEKLKKLQRFQEDAEKRGSEAEATNAALRIQELLQRYNISLEEVGDLEPGVSHEKLDILDKSQKSEGNWRKDLWSVVAKTNFCKVLNYGNGKWSICLVGEDHNRLVVKDLCESLIPRIKSLGAQAWKEYKGHEKRNAFLRGFYLGCTNRIGQRLIEAMSEVTRNDNQVHGLVLRKDAKITEYCQNNFSYGRARQTRGISGIGGLQAGRTAGDKVSINRGVAGRSTQKYLG